ncbi:hypothetical protein ASF10_08000 [Flavobacterium sp. Leaf82]|uniref:hypothetical protein n=1 Tax=unclassified Flavobacterium TaxID=196869 RepID=UPI0007011E28|nr:hypothetical protein [Flavobacterium sp. Leaf82]KQO25100.1 hypothetical protein ASF10_08000 [Flavobacterium sp. Leaf82]
MNNNTLEKYKRAIRLKYEIEKEGEYFDYLYSPSRGKLRDFCWLIFENNATQDDLNVFRNLFSIDFDHTKKNKFKEQKDKFRPIETFFKGETDPSNIDAINLAAVMVDFQPRPFKNFNKMCRIEDAKQVESSYSAKQAVEVENKRREIASLVKDKNEKSGEYPKHRNLFSNFATLFSKKRDQERYPGNPRFSSG